MKKLCIIFVLGLSKNVLLASSLPDPRSITQALLVDIISKKQTEMAEREKLIFFLQLLDSPPHLESLRPIINQIDSGKKTLLERAISFNLPAVVLTMLDRRKELGLDIDTMQRGFRMACRYNLNLGMKLFDRREELQIDINHADAEGKTVFMDVCAGSSSQHTFAMKILDLKKELRIDLNKQSRFDRTAFMDACAYENLDLALKMLEFEEEIDFSKKDFYYYPRTAFLYACSGTSFHFNPVLALKMFNRLGERATGIDVNTFNLGYIKHCFVKYTLVKYREQKNGRMVLITSLPQLLLDMHQEFHDLASSLVKTDTEVFTFLQHEESRLGFVLDALKYTIDCHELEIYKQEMNIELRYAYEMWLRENDYRRLSNFFVYLGNKIKADHQRIAAGVFDDPKKNLEGEADDLQKLVNTLMSGLAKKSYEDVYKESVKKKEDVINFSYDALYQQPISIDPYINGEAMIVFIGETFFKSYDHLLMVLYVLAYVEQDTKKKDVLYTLINNLFQACTKEVSVHFVNYMDQRLVRSFIEKINTCINSEVSKTFRVPVSSLKISGDIRYHALMHNEEAVWQLLGKKKMNLPSNNNEAETYYLLKYTMPSMVEEGYA